MRFLRILTALFMLATAGTVSAQIPVTDAASIAKSVANQVETIAKWQQQYQQMTSQINQLQQQYSAVTGTRNLGNIMNNPALREYLPNDWQGVYDSVRNGGYSGLSGRAASIYSQSQVYDSCANLPQGSSSRYQCEGRAVKPAQDQAFALDAYDKAKSRLNQIDGLMGQINATTDPKAIAELQGRIAAEQAMIQNEQTKLQLYQMVSQAEEKIQQQQQREAESATWANRAYIRPTVPTFSR